MEMTGRAGRYISQRSGYRAFVPSALPPKPDIQFDTELQALLSKADRALGRLDGSIQTLPDPDLFVLMFVRKEAVHSSQIEGTQSSLDDVLEAEAAVFRPERPRDVDEVINHVEAMNHGLARLPEMPISVRLIREIHAKLMHGVRGKDKTPGELRTSQNWIGPGGAAINEATFVPPPPDHVPDALANLERFIHARDDLPALVRVGLAHAQFETIHPFLDGNGRVGRLLITFMLCERRILTRPVLYLSHYFRRFQTRYYEFLQKTRDDGDWEAWLKFFLTAAADVSEEATTTARRIVSLREKHREVITATFGRTAANGYQVLESLFSHPLVTVNEIAQRTGTSFTVANKLTRRFVENGILEEVTGQARNRVFRYSEYVDIFADR